jgi:hypothetical protein
VIESGLSPSEEVIYFLFCSQKSPSSGVGVTAAVAAVVTVAAVALSVVGCPSLPHEAVVQLLVLSG